MGHTYKLLFCFLLLKICSLTQKSGVFQSQSSFLSQQHHSFFCLLHFVSFSCLLYFLQTFWSCQIHQIGYQVPSHPCGVPTWLIWYFTDGPKVESFTISLPASKTDTCSINGNWLIIMLQKHLTSGPLLKNGDHALALFLTKHLLNQRSKR